MKSTSVYILLLALLFVAGSACKKDEVVPPGPELTETQQLRVNELNQYLFPLDGADPDLPFTDMDGLAFLGDAHFVGMGEATHGTREFFRMKHRLFKYLVENHGFRVFGFEADFAESLYFEAYVTGSDEVLVDLMTEKMHFWTWQTQEVLELLEWMRSYNEGKESEEQLHYYGFDCQIPIYNVDMLTEKLAALDPAFADSVAQALVVIRNLHVESDLTNQEWDEQSDTVAWLVESIEQRADDLEGLSTAEELALIQRLARVVEQCLDVQRAYTDQSSINPRDKYMAENARWIADFLGEDTKMALWAHNLHVNNNASWNSMGNALRNELGKDYQIAGFAFSKGWFRAYNSGQGLQPQQLISEPLSGSYNQIFHHAESENFYLRMADIPYGSVWNEWMQGMPELLNIGAVFEGSAAPYYFPSNLEVHYDLIFYFDETAAAESL